jgi:hypothetical protein
MTTNLDAALTKIDTSRRDRIALDANTAVLCGRVSRGMSLADAESPRDRRGAMKNTFDIPGGVPEYVRPALGDPEDSQLAETTCGRGMAEGNSHSRPAWNHAADEAVNSATPAFATRGPVPVAG